MNKIELKQNNIIIDNIISLEFNSELTELCSNINVEFPVKFNEILNEYEKIEIYVNGEKLFTGWIDELVHDENNVCKLTSRSLPSVLVDSQIYLEEVEFLNVKLVDFIKKVCGRFELDFFVPAKHRVTGIVEEKISYKPEDKAFSVLDSLIIKHGLMLGSDEEGRLVVREVENPKNSTVKVISYIKNISYKNNLKVRFMNYQAKNNDKEVTETDNEIKKKSYFIKTKLTDSPEKELRHELNMARMTSQRVSVTIPYINELVREGDFVSIKDEKYLVGSSNFSLSSSGSTQNIGLVDSNIFNSKEEKIRAIYLRLRAIREAERKKAEKEKKRLEFLSKYGDFNV